MTNLKRLQHMAEDNPQPPLDFYRGICSVAAGVLPIPKNKPFYKVPDAKRPSRNPWSGWFKAPSPGAASVLCWLSRETGPTALQHHYETLFFALLQDRDEFPADMESTHKYLGDRHGAALYGRCQHHSPDLFENYSDDLRRSRHQNKLSFSDALFQTTLNLYRGMLLMDFVVGEDLLYGPDLFKPSEGLPDARTRLPDLAQFTLVGTSGPLTA